MTLNYDVAPIFIVGYMHSGTTLLLNIVQKAPFVFTGLGETKYFDHLPIVRKQYRDLDSDLDVLQLLNFIEKIIHQGYVLKTAESTVTTEATYNTSFSPKTITAVKQGKDYGLAFRLVFDELTIISGKKRWLEKTPTHVFHIEEILHSIPDALFIEIVRDPRDVLASKKTRLETINSERYRPEQRSLKRLEKAYDPVWDTISWKSAVRSAQAAKEKYRDQIITVRYEDLVTRPEKEVDRIFHFLQLPFSNELLQVSSRNAAEWKHSRLEGIDSTSVGRWQNVLEPVEVAICQRIARAEMKDFNYTYLPVSWTTRLGEPLLMIQSAFEFGQRLYKRWRLGGSQYLFAVVQNYGKRWRKITRY